MVNFFIKKIKAVLRNTRFYRERLIKIGVLKKQEQVCCDLDEAPVIKINKKFNREILVGIVKTQNDVDFEGYLNPRASWLRYERFCKANNIAYKFYDILGSGWLEEAKSFDIIVCHTEGSPAYQEMYESKVYILENFYNKKCFPSFHEVWQYENKVRSHYLYDHYNLPAIPTVVTYDENEAYQLGDKLGFPLILKTTIGAGSKGVEKIDNQSSLSKVVKSIFSDNGRKTIYPYQRQKNYIYAQKFIADAEFDLRIIVIGSNAFGYYRYPNVGDFRASGAGNYEKKAIPEEALKLAVKIRNKLDCRQIGVDLLYSKEDQEYLIIETSVFNQIDTPVQLEVNGISGRYDVSDISDIKFIEGKFWIQELLMLDLLNNFES